MKNYNGLRFDEIVSYVDTHFADLDMSVDLLCTQFNTSPYIIGCCFKDFTGKTFLEYVIALRMEYAVELLLSDTCDIKEIAFRVGYSHPSYFARIFKRNFGVTPSVFREQHRNEDAL